AAPFCLRRPLAYRGIALLPGCGFRIVVFGLRDRSIGFRSAILVVSLLLAIDGAAMQAKEGVDLIVAGGTVITMDGARRVIENGAVAIRGERIVAVGAASELAGRYQPARGFSAGGGMVLPGFIKP